MHGRPHRPGARLAGLLATGRGRHRAPGERGVQLAPHRRRPRRGVPRERRGHAAGARPGPRRQRPRVGRHRRAGHPRHDGRVGPREHDVRVEVRPDLLRRPRPRRLRRQAGGASHLQRLRLPGLHHRHGVLGTGRRTRRHPHPSHRTPPRPAVVLLRHRPDRHHPEPGDEPGAELTMCVPEPDVREAVR
ncbi:hypothetical protein FRIGORI9N_100008 [Frigoribacterium sp. 9N]|nr:hypothetical protein FRIGORI9N_100008 [Frigoribacterium sp. 9N]